MGALPVSRSSSISARSGPLFVAMCVQYSYLECVGPAEDVFGALCRCLAQASMSCLL